MLDIPRANPYLQPILDDLHHHYLSCKSDQDLAFNKLSKADQEWIDQELLHCMVDPRYYLENYHAVKTEEEGIKGLYPFWESQEIFYDEVQKIKKLRGIVKLLCLKARQQGASTLSEGLIFHKTIFTEACNSLIVAQDGDQSGFMFEMSRTAFDYLPWWMRPEKRYEQAGKLIAFDRVDETVRQVRPGLKSNIFVEAANKISGAARGKTVRAAHLSELAFWDDGGQLTKSIFPTMNASDTLAIMESTANGRHGFFYEFWRKTMEGKTDWNPLFIEFFRVKKYSRPLKSGTVWVLSNEEEKLREKIQLETDHVISNETFNWMRMKKEEFIATDGDEFTFYQEYPCVIGTTRVPTAKGIKKIEDIKVGDVTDGKTVVGWWPKGVHQVYKARTKMGYEIVGTYDHVIPTASGDCELGDMEGKIVELKHPGFSEQRTECSWTEVCNAKAAIPVDEDFASFLGYFMGDGSFGSGTVSIRCDARDEDVVFDVERLLRKYFGNAHRRTVGNKDGGTEVRVGAARFKVVMEALGIWKDEGPHRKLVVPEQIWRSPKSVVKEFLCSLFEADRFAGYGSPKASLFSKSREFLLSVQQLLLGFGVTCAVVSEDKRAMVDGKPHVYTGNSLRVRAAETRLFMKEIGFRSQRKTGKIRDYDCPKGRPQAKIQYRDVVVSVEPYGDADVFDIMLDHDHTFSANGIVIHNCTAMEAFQGTGLCAFPKRKLQNILATCPKPKFIGEIRFDAINPRKPITRLKSVLHGQTVRAPETEDRLFVWQTPEADETYYLGVDVAMGNMGGDYSVVEVLKIGKGLEPDIQVAEWRGWINPTPFARVVAALGFWYNEAQISIEVNSVGMSTNNELMRVIEYENIYRWKHLDSITRFLTNKVGWYTNSKSRDALISKGVEAVEENTIVINSEWLIDEMLDFSQDEDSSKFEGQDTNDDRVMAFLIARYCAHDSDYGKQAAARPMSRNKKEGVLVVRDRFDRKIYAGSNRTEAQQCLLQNKGSSIRQEMEARDFQNSDFSPVHDTMGTRSRMYREHGYSPEEIDSEAIAEFEANEAPPADEDPEAWKYY